MENWRKIKNASNIYFEAAHVLFENFDNGMKNNIEIEKSLIIPQVVLQIFSCELSLKALLLRENIVYTNTHDLKSLFNKLPIQYKNNIKISVVNDMRLKFKCKLCLNGMPVPLLRNCYSIFNGTKYR